MRSQALFDGRDRRRNVWVAIKVLRPGIHFMLDHGLRIAAQPPYVRRCPDLLSQKRPEILCSLGCVEEVNDHDVLRIVIGLKDVCRLDATLR